MLIDKRKQQGATFFFSRLGRPVGKYNCHINKLQRNNRGGDHRKLPPTSGLAARRCCVRGWAPSPSRAEPSRAECLPAYQPAKTCFVTELRDNQQVPAAAAAAASPPPESVTPSSPGCGRIHPSTHLSILPPLPDWQKIGRTHIITFVKCPYRPAHASLSRDFCCGSTRLRCRRSLVVAVGCSSVGLTRCCYPACEYRERLRCCCFAVGTDGATSPFCCICSIPLLSSCHRIWGTNAINFIRHCYISILFIFLPPSKCIEIKSPIFSNMTNF